jgi:hypothetical protein
MKLQIIIALSTVCIFAAGCSTTTFTEFRGQGVLEGKGGTVRKVGGIDFWENGEPDRKYRILGLSTILEGTAFSLRVRTDQLPSLHVNEAEMP